MNNKRILDELISWTKALAIALIIAVIFNTFVLQTYRVQGQSMLPTVHEDDFAVIYKLTRTFEYEDIVVVDSRVQRTRSVKDLFAENAIIAAIMNTHDENIWIKRVIGLPGDKLEFKGNELYRNGLQMDEPYIKEHMRNNPDKAVTVPEGCLFVMGDNRNNSSDSRFIGSIPYTHVFGKVIFRK